MDLLLDKVAIVTGSGSGIGRSSAILFANEGAKVVVADCNSKSGLEVVERIKTSGGESIFVETDVSSSTDAQRLVKESVSAYGKIDILFNNAGINLEKTVIQTTEEEFDRVIDVNLKGVFLCSKYVIPEMIRNGGGVIINTSSIRGLVADKQLSAYCASKAGVVLLTKAMAIDFASDHIRVNCICPGQILTAMGEAYLASFSDPEAEKRKIAEKIPLLRLGSPQDVAEAALFLASEKASFITGIALPVDGGRLQRV